MPVFLNGDRKILFVHIPKTGGTTLERMLVASQWEMRFRATSKSEPRIFGLRRCSPQHYHAALLREVFDLSAFSFRFLVVRDPIARFRSEYLHRTRDLTPPPIHASAVEDWAERAFAAYEADPYVYDNHLRPQAEFALEDAAIYRLEDGFDHAVADLERRLGCPIHRDVSRGQDSLSKSGVSSSAVEISARLERLLRERYAADFEMFGY